MMPNVFFATTVIFLAIGFFLLQECAFLIPYRTLLIEKYGRVIALYAAALFFNLFCSAKIRSGGRRQLNFPTEVS